MIYVSGNLMMFKSSMSSEVKENPCFKHKNSIIDEIVAEEYAGSFKPFIKLTKFNNSEDCRTISAIYFSWAYCLILSDGEAFLFGFINNSFGELLRLSVPDKSKIIEGCCTNYRCHFVTEDGDFWSYVIKTGKWMNVNNLLRTERTSDESLEDDLAPTSNRNLFVYKVSCGDHMTIAVTKSGIYSVPSLLSSPPLKVLNVTSGKDHTMILTDVGCVYTWGNGSRGQLGHGELDAQINPREVEALTGLKVIAVAAGGWHSCCLTEHGDLYSWGWNSYGQLGFPGEADPTLEKEEKSVVSVLAEPRPVDWSDDEVIVKQVSCGSRHTVVVLEDHTVWGCGWNKYGQLHEDGLPEKVIGMTKIKIPEDVSKRSIKIMCSEWNTVFIT